MELTSYLNAIDIASEKSTRLLEIQVHQGYRSTLERYLENANRLSKEQLWAILSLYSIEDLADIPPASFDGILLRYIPIGEVKITRLSDAIMIRFTPTGDVTLSKAYLRITSVPIGDIILPRTLRLVNVPIGDIDIDLTALLMHTPIGDLQFKQDGLELTNTPIGDILYVTQITAGWYYWGFAPYGNSLTRSAYQSYVEASIERMLTTTSYSTEGFLQKGQITAGMNTGLLTLTQMEKNLPFGNTAYYVFLIPETAKPRAQWSNALGFGAIGGALNEETWGNHWPDPTVITYQGKDYYLYLGNRRRYITGNINITS